MPKELDPEQISKILEKLPEDLKEVFFSIETAEKIGDICKECEVPEEKIHFVTDYIGRVLLGVLTPEEFQEALEKDAGFKKTAAQNIAQQANRQIFLSIRGILTPKKTTEETGPREEGEEKETSSQADTYREPVE